MERTKPDFKTQACNQLLNVFWTVLSFLPVLWYWMGRYPDVLLYGSIAISTLCGLLPSSFFDSLQLSNNPDFYKKYGVKTIKKIVQNGDFINMLFRKRDPHYKVIQDVRKMQNYLNTILMYERYHFTCFIFFLMTTLLSFFQHYFMIPLLTTFCNVVYNVCPIFLQQYNRLRINKVN
ncbi:hypothetical protein [Pedobacter immunditicola]|uniref:glycosyl-4,4'-diaponeurosporenoate acyltransferase CrtO family protein n=1 Tax=Pedobacter immunditicola TaxID=3133440 RepID=UPI0030A1775B